MVRVMHVRRYDPLTGLLCARGGFTIAADFVRGIVGVARCTERDNYSKRIGRQIALARMERGMNLNVSPRDYPVMRYKRGPDDYPVVSLHILFPRGGMEAHVRGSGYACSFDVALADLEDVESARAFREADEKKQGGDHERKDV